MRNPQSRIWLPATALLLAGCGSLPAPDDRPANVGLFTEDQDPSTAQLTHTPHELLVHTAPGAATSDLNAAFDRAGAAVVDALPELNTTVVQVDPINFNDAAARLSIEPVVEGVQKNYYYPPERLPQDPRFVEQDYLSVIGLPEAWEISTGSADVLTAVLNSGLSTLHPDLDARVLTGWNTFDRTRHTDDDYGHGTLVAGVLAAATDNDIGLAGVTWTSPILPIRVTGTDGRATARSIASGLGWAAQRGVRVANVSFAPLQADRTILRAAQYAQNHGTLVFASAGNDGDRSSAVGNSALVFVGATDATDARAEFSSTGPFVDLAAPGVEIWSTTADGDYRAVSGTSYASPMAAGVASLVFAIRPDLRPTTVEQLLRETATDLGVPGPDEAYGAGRIDAAAALAAALDLAESPDDRGPLVEFTAPDELAEAPDILVAAVTAVDPDAGAGVADVVLALDGRPVATDAFPPYRFALRTTRLQPGTHTLRCVATDAAGNASTPAEVRFVVPGDTDDLDEPSKDDRIRPTALINFPIDGATVSGQVGAQATVTDNLALAQIEWLVDGQVRQTTAVSGTRAVTTFLLQTTGLTIGDHVLAVRVQDEAGNVSAAGVTLRVP